MIRVSGLLIEDMRTAVCIRFCVAAKEGGAGAGEGACRRSETEARRDRSPQTADAGEKRRARAEGSSHEQDTKWLAKAWATKHPGFCVQNSNRATADGVAASLGEREVRERAAKRYATKP